MTEPALPALALDGLEAVVLDTDGVLTDIASVHAAAWKRLFDEYLRSIDGRPRYDGVAGFLASRGIHLPWGDPSDSVASASRNMAAVLDSAGLRELFDVEVDGVEADRLGLPGKPDPALAERGADVVVTDLGNLVLEGAVTGRGGR